MLNQNSKLEDMEKVESTPIIQMFTHEEEMLLDLMAKIIVNTTLRELYEQKRNKISEIQQ